MSSESYQFDMMRCLRDVNADYNTVGWYQSVYLGSFFQESIIMEQYDFQTKLDKSVMIVHDPIRTAQGRLWLQAYRLTASFMEMFSSKQHRGVTRSSLSKHRLSFNDVFEEIPIHIHNSELIKTLLVELADSGHASETDYEKLSIGTNAFLEKNIEFLTEGVEDFQNVEYKYQYYERQVARQKQERERALAKYNEENRLRRGQGEPGLPPFDERSFPPIPEPSGLQSLLLSNQVAQYCEQINQYCDASFSKLFLSQTLAEQPSSRSDS